MFSTLHCLFFSPIFEEGTTSIEEIAFFSCSHPLPCSPSGITRKVDFLLEANSKSLINLPWLLKQTSIKWTLDFPLYFLLKPMKLFNTIAFTKYSINQPTCSFPKPKKKTEPLLYSESYNHVPPDSPSNLTWNAFFSRENLCVFSIIF